MFLMLKRNFHLYCWCFLLSTVTKWYYKLDHWKLVLGCVRLPSLGRPRCGVFYFFFQDERGHTITPRSSSNLEKKPRHVTTWAFPWWRQCTSGQPQVTLSRSGAQGAGPRCNDVTTGRLTWWRVWGFFQVRGRTWGNCVPTLVLEKNKIRHIGVDPGKVIERTQY